MSCSRLLVVPHRVEDLTDRQRGRGVLANEPERFLVLGRCAVLQLEQVVGLKRLAELRRLDGRHPVVTVV